jgi:ParD-like antitoxin of type II bacterial toxin-antitoxin system
MWSRYDSDCPTQQVARNNLWLQNTTYFKEDNMAVAMKLSDELVEDAKPYAAAEHRSVPRQIEYWARIGKAVTDNPDMPLSLIQDIMLAREEAKAGLATPYEFG